VNLAAAAPQTLGLLMLEGDPLHRRIAVEARLPLVKSALQDGRRRAVEAVVRWGNDPDAIARACGIPVSDSNETADYGSTLVFAEYLRRPARIVLYRPAIRRIDNAIAAHGFGEAFALRGARSILLAHELYHHFDSSGSGAPLARRHRVVLFAWGPLRWSSGLTSLPEIAAGAFAQALLDLPFHPKVLELMLTRDFHPLRAPAPADGEDVGAGPACAP